MQRCGECEYCPPLSRAGAWRCGKNRVSLSDFWRAVGFDSAGFQDALPHVCRAATARIAEGHRWAAEVEH